MIIAPPAPLFSLADAICAAIGIHQAIATSPLRACSKACHAAAIELAKSLKAVGDNTSEKPAF